FHDGNRRAAGTACPRLASGMADAASAPPGAVSEINISPRPHELPSPVERVRAVAGRGLEGDRNFLAEGAREPHRDADLTLIASEALEALAEETGLVLTAAESRRNLLTRGVDLNTL